MIDLAPIKKWSPREGEMSFMLSEEVSLVGKPANRRKYLMTKSQRGAGMDIEQILKSVEPENENEIVEALKSAGIDGEAAEIAVAINRLVSAYDEIDAQVLSTVLGIEQANTNTGEENVEDIEKAVADLPESIQQYIRKSQEENEALREQVDGLAKGIVERENQRKMDKFRGEVAALANLSVETEDLAKAVKSVHDANPEAAELMLKTLKSANEVAGEDDLYKSVGSSGDGPGNVSTQNEAADELDSRARELVNKGEAETMAQAQEQVLKSDRELSKQYFG